MNHGSVMQVVWALTLSVILGVFANLMAIGLVQPSRVRTVPFQTLAELGDKLLDKSCRFVLPTKHIEGEEFMDTIINATHNRPWAKSFRKAYINNSPRLTSDRDETMEILVNNTDLSCWVTLDYTTMETYYKSRYCDIRFLSFPEEIKGRGYVFYYKEKRLFSPQIETVMATDSLMAYVHYLEKKYYSKPFPPKCLDRRVRVEPLPFYKVKECFYVFAAGMALNLSLFLIEIAIKWALECHRRQKVHPCNNEERTENE